MKFTPVATANEGGAGNGLLEVIRGGNLIANGVKTELEKGYEVIGTYEGATKNKFNEARLDFKLRKEDGTLVIMAETSALRKAFSQIDEGTVCQVVFNGKIAIKNGKTYNDIKVATAMDDGE